MAYGLAMYLPGKGHNHFGPGTSMVQRINWTTGEELRLNGMGGCSTMGTCGAASGNCNDCKCSDCGCMDCGRGLGLFESGLDLNGWGWPEFAVAAFAVLGMFQLWTGTKRAGRAARDSVRSTRRKVGGAISGKGGGKQKKGWLD